MPCVIDEPPPVNISYRESTTNCLFVCLLREGRISNRASRHLFYQTLYVGTWMGFQDRPLSHGDRMDKEAIGEPRNAYTE